MVVMEDGVGDGTAIDLDIVVRVRFRLIRDLGRIGIWDSAHTAASLAGRVGWEGVGLDQKDPEASVVGKDKTRVSGMGIHSPHFGSTVVVHTEKIGCCNCRGWRCLGIEPEAGRVGQLRKSPIPEPIQHGRVDGRASWSD